MDETDLDTLNELKSNRDYAAVELAEAICAKEFYKNATEEYRKVIQEKVDSKLERYKKAKRVFQDVLESYGR